MLQFEQLSGHGDLRSIGKANTVVATIHSQRDFDELFEYLFYNDRLVVMRAADAVEKITVRHPQYLVRHKKMVLALCKTASNKELTWHLALMLPRLKLDHEEVTEA